MLGAAPTAANATLRSRSAAAPVSTWPGAPRLRPRRSGVLRPLCALAAVLAVALWPAAAHARVNAGRAGTEQPRLWGVEIGTHAGTFARPTHLARMKHAGINAVVLDPRRLTLKELRATVKAAKGARLWVIELIPPAHAKATRSVKAVRATCRASRKPAQTLCAQYGLALGRDRAVAQQRFRRPDSGRAPGRAGAGWEAPRCLFVRLADPRLGQAEGAQICDL